MRGPPWAQDRSLHDHIQRWHRGRRTLFWRVFRHGILLIFLTGFAAGVASSLFQGDPPWRRLPDGLALWTGAEYTRLGGDRDRLSQEMRDLRDIQPVAMTWYGADGALMASNVTPPLRPLDRADVPQPGASHRSLASFRGRYAMPVVVEGRPAGYLRIDFPAGGGAPKAVGVFLTVLGVVALLSFPLARHLADPVSRLTRVVQAFGQGDLGARVGAYRRDELGELGRSFDAMADRLQQLILSQKELLANVSHELRTPLARIRVAVELAEDEDGGAAPYLREISQDLGELERMLEDVLTTARLDLAEGRAGSADLPLRPAEVDPAALAGEAADRFHAQWPGRALALEVEGAVSTLVGDPVLLRRVVDNLLDNARKYSPEGVPIRLRVASEGEGARFEVIDRGEGIDPEDLPRLFDPFFRADRSRTRGTGGVGLGLALARRIVEAHGGHIEAVSRLGEGTTVRFTLPAAPPPREEPAPRLPDHACR